MTDTELLQIKKDFAAAKADNPTCYDPGEIVYLQQDFFKNHAAKLIEEVEAFGKQISVKLFRFSLPDEKEVLYLYSIQTDDGWLRKQLTNQDEGGLGYETYKRLYTEGKIERITSLEQVTKEDRQTIPYNSGELNDYGFNLYIVDFFDEHR